MTGSRKFRRRSHSHPEQGYILLTLMFLATLVILSLAALAPQMAQQVKRDQEEELIHRGVQYARAIQHFYKKTGRYPVRLEELDNFNNVRFIRKHYKDPITGEDFKLLHYGEIRTMFGAGAGIPGAVAAANMNAAGGVNPQAAVLAQGAFNQVNSMNGNQLNGSQMSGQGIMASPMNQAVQGSAGTAVMSSSSGPQFDSSSSSPDGQNPNASTTIDPAGANGPVGLNGPSGFGNPGQQFGGGPIVGVASTSKKKSIREFNKKNHYKDWQFIYDPSSDRGGLLNTPAQPSLNAGANLNQGNNQAGPGQGQGFGPQGQQPNGFGQPNSFGQQPNTFGQQSMPMPNQPPDQMQQPQQ
ncbi:MAG TPA: hypothetical protein VF011_11730 [Terriglobales bacterium]